VDLAGSLEDIWKRQYTLLHSDTIDSLSFRPALIFLIVAIAQAGSFQQEVAHTYTTEDGLLSNDVTSVAVVNGQVFAKTSAGVARFSGGRWSPDTTQLPVRSNLEVTDSLGRVWSVRAGAVIAPYTPADGLPYDKITSIAAGEQGVIWLATPKGAIRFDGKNWEYRQGPRWLPDDDVRAIAVEANGNAWFATKKGIALIERRRITFAEKAKFFEDEIDLRHRRTQYGYVLGVRLKRPGDKSEWTQQDSDNDGLWTSMYGAGECFAYAATGSELAKRRAKAAFEALRFLRVVTEGGNHPAPHGFVARSILPTSGPDPNKIDTREHDQQKREKEDRLWKVMSPRWPVSADGKWYWKTDTSSDELDGHFFFYALYYDLVASTGDEKSRVREQVSAIADHLLDHNLHLVDYDRQPTRWGVFNPESLNHASNWWEERGLNSLSILTYLKIASHVTGNAKYSDAARKLIEQYAYDQNVLIPKTNAGPGSGNQSDDEMAFMDFYNLIRYETDPKIQPKYALAFSNYWSMERPELNPLFNFMYAATNTGRQFKDAYGKRDLTPAGEWLEESLDTLRRYPLDRVNWRLTNSHRTDIVPLPAYAREPGAKAGLRNNGKVLPIDERFLDQWNHDPWELDQGGDGLELADGASFLLPYYMGLYHKFINADGHD
jgi:hypothetical protein